MCKLCEGQLAELNSNIDTCYSIIQALSITINHSLIILLGAYSYVIKYPDKKYTQYIENKRMKALQVKMEQLATIPYMQQHEREQILIKKNVIQMMKKLHQECQKIFFVIKEIPYRTLNQANQNRNSEQCLYLGLRPKQSPVKVLVQFLHLKNKTLINESIELICNNIILNMRQTLQNLPKNEIGVVEIYFVRLEAFG